MDFCLRYKSRFKIALVLLLFFPNLVFSLPREMTIAVGFSLEPYVFSNGNGIFNELVYEAVKDTPVKVSLVYLSNADAIKAYEAGRYDAVAIVRPGMASGFYSVPVIQIEDKAISLQSSGILIERVAQLKNYRVLGYSRAADYIGGEYKQVSQANAAYREVAHQSEQVRALYLKEADVVISNEIIFRYYLKRLRYGSPNNPGVYYQKYLTATIFEPVDYHIAFRDKAHQLLFDKGLLRLRQEKIDQKIINKYTRLIHRY